MSGFKRRGEVDYATEIPFQKVAPAGFYDVGEEQRDGRETELRIGRGISVDKMNNKMGVSETERERTDNIKRMKNMMKQNAERAIKLSSAANDPLAMRKRSKLMLPSPQVTDGDLEEAVRLGQRQAASAASGVDASMPPPVGSLRNSTQHASRASAATSALSSSYVPTDPSADSAQRTPMQEDVVAQEARNQAILRGMTPFVEKDLQVPTSCRCLLSCLLFPLIPLFPLLPLLPLLPFLLDFSWSV